MITAKSGSEATVEAALTELAAASEGDQGCLSYELFASDTPGAFVTIEKWESQADIDAHMASAHIMKMIKPGAKSSDIKVVAAADLQYYGGRVVSNVQVVPVTVRGHIPSDPFSKAGKMYELLVSE